MLYNIVSETKKFGQFRWSGFFSNQQTGTVFDGINYQHLLSDRNSEENLFISSKSNLLELFLTSHISTMLYHILSETSKLGQFRWSGFFSYQQTGTIFNGINYGHLPPDRNRMIVLLSLPNRIFWNFSHKPHFHNAISHSVRN